MAHRYINVKVRISEGQKQKLRKALQSGSDSISIRLTHEDLTGQDVIALTQAQINKLAEAYQNTKGLTIKMSKTQLAHNMKIEGGFLPILAKLASSILPVLTGTVLPALATGALSGLTSTGVSKLMGNGLYLKKGGCVCQIETDGKGVYLGPATSRGFESVGNGLYLKKGDGLYDGSGLILGPNSPFKDIPILGMIL
jgi:hypothetical protein